MTLEELLLELKNLEYTSDVLGARSNFHVINLKHFNRVENLIRQYALDHHDEELGVLKAKVYAYEQIIANSNFAPMIIKKENTVDEWQRDGRKEREKGMTNQEQYDLIWEKAKKYDRLVGVFDKIKDEIKDNTYFINETTEKEGIDYETVEKIINKHKAESEG